MQKSYKSQVYAKLNLNLAITGKAGELHTLNSVVCPYFGYADEVEFYPSDKDMLEIEVYASFDGFDENKFLAFYLPKAQAVASKLGVGGRLVVRKGVPLGAGLGGSTASIVAMLNAMKQFADEIGNLTVLDNGFLLSLGSDVPCVLYGKSCKMFGVGEGVAPIEIPLKTNELYVQIAEGGSDTKKCYALYDELIAKGEAVSKTASGFLPQTLQLMNGDLLFANDLTLPATILNPQIDMLIAEMRKRYQYVAMSGSGSAVIGYILKK